MDASAVSTSLHDAAWESLPEDARPERLTLRRAFMLAHVGTGEKVLDIGCGAGEFSAALIEAGARPIAVDIAREALRRARERVADIDARLWEPGQRLPVEDGGVDAVWAGEVIEHVPDVAPWLSELRRVLKPRGMLLLTAPHHGPATLLRLALSPRAFAEHFEPRSDHVQYFSPRTLRELLDDLGFDVAEVRCAGGPPGMRSTILVRATRG